MDREKKPAEMTGGECLCDRKRSDEGCTVCSGETPSYWCDVCQQASPEKRCPLCGLKARKQRQKMG